MAIFMITLNPNPAYIIIGSMNGFLAYHYKTNIPQYDANIILFKKANEYPVQYIRCETSLAVKMTIQPF